MPPDLKRRLYRLRRAYKGMIAAIDVQVGLLLDKLERENLLDSTVIFFTCDHGEMLGDRGRMSKMQPWRQSVVVPTAMRHPQFLNRRTCTAPVELTDVAATILDVSGVDPRVGLSKPWPAFHDRVPCRSLLPIVAGTAQSVRDYAFSECMNVWELVATEEWKYVRYAAGRKGERAREELYNVGEDPKEQIDLAGDGACRSALQALRHARADVLDATPPAQLGWAPYG
jgi:choline-sulfatase